MPDQKDILVRLNPARQPIINEAQKKMQTHYNRKTMSYAELMERLAQFYIENLAGEVKK